MTEAEFHIERRMFLVYKDTVLLAPRECPHSHRKWLAGIFSNPDYVIGNYTRGYVLDDRLMAYRGRGFSDRVKREDVLLVLILFEEVKVIGFGAIPGKEQPWPAVREIPVGQFILSGDC